ncbi:DsbA family protein [Pseudoclavibacter alba]|uniref:DsbA family protein n=1 Tax=Pseudoclavibacter albus TaxID=272241 RepID=A0ABT2HUC6_9MICO|nr:thioredoxin domain-containing protein [Pseudoclavibacter alba]MBN6778241.1 DsbA family protein [Pseudoclavibacter alba]MCT2041919.1 DsbA family protein [Pseudoclavibacter alba]
MATKDREHIRRLREEANEIRRKQEAEAKRKRLVTTIGLSTLAVAVVALIVVMVVFGPKWFGPKAATVAGSGNVAVMGSDGKQTEVPIAMSEDGVAIMVGKPEAPVTLDYWFDFSCPHCIDYHTVMDPTMKDLIVSGQAKINYRPVNIVAPYGKEAAAALLAVMAHQPELFYSVTDGLLDIPAQEQMNWTANDYAQHLSGLGVTNTDIITETANGTYRSKVESNTQVARDAKLKGTPSLAVNGQMQEQLPDAAGLIALVGANGGDVSAVPTPAAAPAA